MAHIQRTECKVKAVHDAINHIKGSIATSDLVPAYKQVQIHDGLLSASNSILSASACIRVPVDLSCRVPGNEFVASVKAAGADARLTVTKGGKLCVKGGSFTAYLPMSDEIFTSDKIKQFVLKKRFPPILPLLKKLSPFIARDGQQYWAGGVLFKRKNVFATDSKTLIQLRMDWDLHTEFVLPFQAVKELLRLKKEPTSICIYDTSVGFVFEDDSVLNTAILDADWPHVGTLLNKADYTKCKKIKPSFFDDLAKLAAFTDTDNTVFLINGKLRTAKTANTGVTVQTTEKNKGAYGIDQIQALKGIATKIDLSAWPEPVPFIGKQLRGIISGRTF